MEAWLYDPNIPDEKWDHGSMIPVDLGSRSMDLDPLCYTSLMLCVYLSPMHSTACCHRSSKFQGRLQEMKCSFWMFNMKDPSGSGADIGAWIYDPVDLEGKLEHGSMSNGSGGKVQAWIYDPSGSTGIIDPTGIFVGIHAHAWKLL